MGKRGRKSYQTQGRAYIQGRFKKHFGRGRKINMAQGRALKTVTGWRWKFWLKSTKMPVYKNIAKQKNQANNTKTTGVYLS